MSSPVALNTLITKVTSSISASTTAPTKGSPTTDIMHYQIKFGTMELTWQFVENTGSAAGSGTYLITVPDSYVIDSNFVNIGTTTHSNIVGICAVLNSNGTPVDLQGYVTAYNTTSLAMVVNKTFVGSAYLGLNSADKPVTYSVKASFPVTNRNYLW